MKPSVRQLGAAWLHSLQGAWRCRDGGALGRAFVLSEWLNAHSMKITAMFIACILFASGCKESAKKVAVYPTLIEGQVFVVGPEGDSIKQGAVRVIAVNWKEADANLAEAMETHGPLLRTIKEQAPKESRDMRELSDRMAKEAVIYAVEAAARAKEMGSTYTDADGKFKLYASSEEGFCLIAFLDRRVSGEQRKMAWIVRYWNPLDEVVLGDHNAMTSERLLLMEDLKKAATSRQ